jgi:hypothetical protein
LSVTVWSFEQKKVSFAFVLFEELVA